jgi:hypothetical protein
MKKNVRATSHTNLILGVADLAKKVDSDEGKNEEVKLIRDEREEDDLGERSRN